jgi:predicted chitinase
MKIYYGIVENRSDPLQIGRCQVRIAGIHTHNKTMLPTSDLPWATAVQSITSSGLNGIGETPVGPVEGTTVIITFADDNMQQPVMLGAVPGIATVPPAITVDNNSGSITEQQNLKQLKLETSTIPSTGTQLTFVDYETGRTDLTSTLSPDMRVIGFQIPDGTRIVSIDSPTQITISKPVNDYTRNIITFDYPPTNLQALAESNAYKATPVPESVIIGDVAAREPRASTVNKEIPIVPPAGSSRNEEQSIQGIKALLAACDQVGLTTKEQKCALLGIVGGESNWIPQKEAYNYSPTRLKQIFSFSTDADVERYSRAPNKGISRQEFFEWAYGPQTRGRGFLGNLTKEDGGRYYGRGFIQLTGRYNYRKYAEQARELGLEADILNNPELLNSDINVSAIIAALYLKDRVSRNVSDADHPGYFYAAKRAVGVNSRDIAARKKEYYDYFYGIEDNTVAKSVASHPTARLSAQEQQLLEQITYYNDFMMKYFILNPHGNINTPDRNVEYNLQVTKEMLEELEAGEEQAIAFREQAIRGGVNEDAFVYDRAGNPVDTIEWDDTDIQNLVSALDDNWDTPVGSYIKYKPSPSDISYVRGTDVLGFRDPNNKYPLPEYVDEPDTNRLARGIVDGTVVPIKNKTRITDVRKGVVGGSWDQPESPYSAFYPFNKVYETESGHIQEFDDTPGQERIHTYHRSGTFSEVDANGTQVNFIVGDNYILMERNGYIHVSGECNVTIDGQANINVQSDANIEVAQNAKVEVGNNLEVGVHRDVDFNVGGDMRVNVQGDYSVTAANMYSWSKGEHNIQADTGIDIVSLEDFRVKTKTGLHLFDETKVNIESSQTMDLLSGGQFNVDYSEGHFGEGAASTDRADTYELWETESRLNTEEEVDWTFTFPEEGQPINNSYKPFAPTEKRFEETSTSETPEDWETPEGRFQSNSVRLSNGVSTADEARVAEEMLTPVGGATFNRTIDDSFIMNSNLFANDYQLSPNFTLGMLVNGGVNGRHQLVDQMLTELTTEEGVRIYGKGETSIGQSRLYTKQEIVRNLALLCQNILEPALNFLPQGIDGYGTLWAISSGYRLRGIVGNESPTSQHPKGEAVDIVILSDDLDEKIRNTYETIVELERRVPYDQLILEYRNPSSCWIHCSYTIEGSRKRAFTMLNDRVFRRNAQGIPEGFALLENIPAPARGTLT